MKAYGSRTNKPQTDEPKTLTNTTPIPHAHKFLIRRHTICAHIRTPTYSRADSYKFWQKLKYQNTHTHTRIYRDIHMHTLYVKLFVFVLRVDIRKISKIPKVVARDFLRFCQI